MLRLPKSELPTTAGKDKPKLVRFASVQSTVASDEVEDSPTLPKRTLSPPPSAACETLVTEGTDKKTIMLVEDNPINAKLGQRMLVTLGYNVLVCHNGLEALESAKMAHDSIACILMDCEMPVMSGHESTTLIRKHEAENDLSALTILALSANVNTQNTNKILDAGADGFLGKPISMQGLGEGERVATMTRTFLTVCTSSQSIHGFVRAVVRIRSSKLRILWCALGSFDRVSQSRLYDNL